MEFTVYNREGEGLFYTAYECCIPFEYLDSMASVGLVFYVDGKKLSPSAIRKLFPNPSKISVPKYKEAPMAIDEIVTEVSSTSETSSNSVNKKLGKPKSFIPEKSKSSTVKFDFKNAGFPITSRCIVCTTTGKIYRNQSEAAKDLGFDPAYVSDCVCHDKEYKGYRFKKAVDLQ